jgi:hypothetical protein
MKSIASFVMGASLVGAVAVTGVGGIQAADRELNGPDLKAMVRNLGHEVKDLNTEPGKEKVEFKMASGGYDVWIAAEVSASKRFIWLSAFLGEAAKIPGLDSRAANMLRENFKIQPCHFYITEKGNLMMAIALDNRNMTPTVLKYRIEKLAADVATTAELWKS